MLEKFKKHLVTFLLIVIVVLIGYIAYISEHIAFINQNGTIGLVYDKKAYIGQ